jgi:hypothetical protein
MLIAYAQSNYATLLELICLNVIKSTMSWHIYSSTMLWHLTVKSFDEVREKLAIKLCPTEIQEWERAKAGLQTAEIRLDLSTSRFDQPTSDWRPIMLERDMAKLKKLEVELAMLKCVLKAEPRLSEGSKVENKYLRSGQAERDAGLVK